MLNENTSALDSLSAPSPAPQSHTSPRQLATPLSSLFLPAVTSGAATPNPNDHSEKVAAAAAAAASTAHANAAAVAAALHNKAMHDLLTHEALTEAVSQKLEAIPLPPSRADTSRNASERK
eukprot:4408621-Prymnesium_polylepis.1